MTERRTPLRRLRAIAYALATGVALAGCAIAPAPTVEPPAAAASAAPTELARDEAMPPATAASAPAQDSASADDAAPTTAAAAPVRGRLDPGDDAAHLDLWERVRGGFSMPDLDNDLVRKWEQWYASRPDYVQRMTERGGRYLFHILEEVNRRGMPTELALLPFVESAFNPQAMSVARASGMWQFTPGTGKDFELRQNVFRDDRRDVLASTRAALDYLGQLHDSLGDWQLALAAYNWGQGNVQRAMAYNQMRGRPVDYESLRMPVETRNYVPKLQAVKNIVAHPEAFGLVMPPLENHPYFMTVAVERDIDVALAADLAGLPLDEFQSLNPQMNKPVILAAGTPRVLLPYDSANRFLRELDRHQGALASWTAWVAPRTLKPAEAAHLVGMPEAQLREVNNIPANMRVKAGSTLLVPRGTHIIDDVDEHIADNAAIMFAPEAGQQRKHTFKAGKKGDTVAAVARRYKVSAAQVAAWNDTTPGASFRPGQPVIVMLANPAPRTAAGHPAAAKHGSKPATPPRVAAR